MPAHERPTEGAALRAPHGVLTWRGRPICHSGSTSVAAAADVSRTTLAKILAGTRHQLRAASARRVLAIDRDAIADHALVPAGRTWQRINRLLEEGFTKAELARRFGAKTRALQFGRRRVLASTAVKVERFYRITVAGE